MGYKASHCYALGGFLVLGCYALLTPFQGSSLVFEVVGLSTVAAIGLGLRWYRPRPRLPWVLFMAAQVLVVSGHYFLHTYQLPFPSFADGLHLAFYLLQAAGLLLLIRSRTGGKGTGNLIDSLIVGTGFGLLVWVFLIDRYNDRAAVSGLARVLSLADPALGLLLLLLLLAWRLGSGAGARPWAFFAMVASVVCLIVTDSVYGAIQINGTYTERSALHLGWMAAFVLWGAAALHPSMNQLSVQAPAANASFSGKHLLLLAASTLVAPALIVVDGHWPIHGFDVPEAAGAAALAFILLIVRMVGLVSSEQQAVGWHARAQQREAVLRQAMTALTVASDRESIRRAASGGALGLVSGLDVEVAVDICDAQSSVGGPPPAPPGALVIELSTLTARYGRLVVTGTEPIPADVVDGLRTFGAQVALALEGAAFTAGFHEQRRESWVGALVQNSSDMIFVVDERLVIRYVTPSVLVGLGHRPADLVGESLLGLVEPEEESALTAFFSPPVQHPGDSARAEWRLRRGDGRFTDVEVVSTDLLKNPAVNGILVTARDISERKALEAGLKRQVVDLKALDRIRAEFVAAVSHELRTPLTNIIGEVELLADGDLGDLLEPQARGVNVISRNSDRLLELIDDLLTLSHIEDSDLQLHREPTRVAGLVHDVGSRVAPSAVAKSVDLVLDCAPEAGTAYVDKEQMGRALVNLLTNAVKFTPAGGTVDFRARREGDNFVITVVDTGMGIPLDEQARLFTRFFRSTSATQMAVQGTGLGLVIVKKIVEGHGGTISIVSAPDVGTSVTVTIPADAVPSPQVDAA